VSTLGALVREAAARLEVAGCESPRLDAELLVAHAVGVPRTAVFTEPMRSVDPAAVEPLVVRRERREPVAYILGTKPFRNLELMVTPAVLIPRPETEHLVEAALGLATGARVCDVGTGSGAVALALKHERPDLRVVATDVCAQALAVARENARYHDLDVQFLRGDLLGAVEGDLDAVVSNPPYVAESERASLPPDVAAYEPAQALFAGSDGLDVLRRLAVEAAGRGARFVAFEVARGQAALTSQMLRNAGYEQVEARRDLAGVERVVVGWR
jgi:release factor glutamine methyltransferase